MREGVPMGVPMGKVSEVDIKGHKYRYRYNPDSKATEYLGPVGDAPEIGEKEFLLMLTRERKMRDKFTTKIDFLKWAWIDLEDLTMMDMDQLDRVMISPDTNSLHIVWQWKDGQIQHEIADYDDDKTIEEFLLDEIGDDAWDTLSSGASLEDIIGDYRSQKVEDMDTFKVSEFD